jgi:catechol 2,3-dioxygenase-like lactoylglutathione lyase family enzyme
MSALDLDHVGIAVRDLDAGAAQFRRLGFRLTERGYHTLPPETPGGPRPRAGTANHCAMLERGYLELIGISDPAYGGRLKPDIERYQGVHIVAFGTRDAADTTRDLRARGLSIGDSRPLERPIEEPDGAQLARFEIVDFPRDLLPEGHFFAIRHLTRELLWKAPLMAHPNGARSLEALTIAVADPADFRARLGSCLGVPSDVGGGFALAAGRVTIVDGAWLAGHLPPGTPALPFIAGISVGVADIVRTADLLATSGVPFEPRGSSVWVAPPEACGAFIEFVAS